MIPQFAKSNSKAESSSKLNTKNDVLEELSFQFKDLFVSKNIDTIDEMEN